MSGSHHVHTALARGQPMVPVIIRLLGDLACGIWIFLPVAGPHQPLTGLEEPSHVLSRGWLLCHLVEVRPLLADHAEEFP